MKMLGKYLSATKFLFLVFISSEDKRKYHGYHLLKALEGETFNASLSRFRSTLSGRELLQRKPDSLALLNDISMLEACAPGTLGRNYLDFMNKYGLTQEFLVDLVTTARDACNDDEQRWYRVRTGSTHDLRHVLTGYGADFLGEACLMVFRYAQIRHPGVLLLTVFTVIQARLTSRGPVLAPVSEAYRRGAQAVDLDMLPWEDAWDKSLADQRAFLKLKPPVSYAASFAPDDYVISEADAVNGSRQSLKAA